MIEFVKNIDNFWKQDLAEHTYARQVDFVARTLIISIVSITIEIICYRVLTKNYPMHKILNKHWMPFTDQSVGPVCCLM